MSWRDKAEKVAVASEKEMPDSSHEDARGGAKISPATHGGDDSIAAIQARAKAGAKPISELESLLLGLTRGATHSFAGELGNLVARTPSERKNLSDYYVRAGKDNPNIMALGEHAARLPETLAGAIPAALGAAANAVGASDDKANSVSPALRDAAIAGLLTPQAGKGALSLLSGARKGVANKLTGLANILDAEGSPIVNSAEKRLVSEAVKNGSAPAKSAAIEEATGDLANFNPTLNARNLRDASPIVDASLPAAGMAKGEKQLGARAIETLDRLSGRPTSGPLHGDMGLEVLPKAEPLSMSMNERKELFKSLALDNPALGDLMMDKVANRGLSALSPEKSAIQSLRSKLGNEAATIAPKSGGMSVPEEAAAAEALAEEVGTMADSGMRKAARTMHKKNMLENKAYSEAYKHSK